MLDAGKKRNYNESKIVSIIGQGTTVTGELKSSGTIRIEGVVSGKVESEDTIIVQETGKVKADLVAGQIVINGEVQGNVFAHDRLEVASNGKLLGDIIAPRVSIAEGVIFEGKCTMKPPGQVKSPGASPSQGGPSQSTPPQGGPQQPAPPRQTPPTAAPSPNPGS